MHDVPLLINITLALVVAFIGGMIARRLGFPTIVGYLITGIIIGPFTPGFVGDTETIQQLAELGVIFLMFGVGLHFSFSDLWHVRDIAIPGALIQTLISSILGFGLSQLWGWSVSAGIILGLAISVASTVVLLRGLMDNSLLNTSHGQAAVGWLVMEDIVSVVILVILPLFGSEPGSFSINILIITLVKAIAFGAIMYFAGIRIIPWILEKVALSNSRELFILAILAVTLGTAMGASELFGVSLALGAFVAGAIISQSHLSHQVGADVFAFREAFSVLFFVSVGMLVNPTFLWFHMDQVAALSFLVIIGKLIIVILMGLFIPRPAKTFLIIAVGLSQIGEFSFIIGQTGLSLKMLNTDQYSLLLATALISITLNPFMYRLINILEKKLVRLPGFWKKLDAYIPLPEIREELLENHVVLVGYGRVGKHLVDVMLLLHVPILVIESDAERCKILNQQNIPTIYGEAGNSEVIAHAHLETARILVITLPDETQSIMVIPVARQINEKLPIIARASTQEGVRLLTQLGANHIVHPELEGGLELVHHSLLSLGFPLREVHKYAEAVRHDNYDTNSLSDEEHRSLHDLIRSTQGIEVVWMEIASSSPLVGKTLAEINLRARTGASVVAMIRDKKLIANPKSLTEFNEADCIGVIGDEDQVAAAQKLVLPPDMDDQLDNKNNVEGENIIW